MKYSKGSSVAVGLILGVLVGIVTNNLVTMALLGLAFGFIAEMVGKKKRNK